MTDTGTATQVGNDLSATITIDASPAQVWAAVTDLPRIASWSPQVLRTIVLGGPVRLGTRFLNVNHQGWRHWPTTGKVVRFSPHTDFAFAIAENATVWSFRLEPAPAGGTVVTNRRELPHGDTNLLSKGMVAAFLGGQKPFTASMREGMAATLARLKADLES